MFACRTVRSVEKRFFRTLNRVAEPSIRLGIGSPWLVPVGAVVLETVGRKSGRTYRIPVLASEWRGVLVVSTVRGRSQWMKNVAVNPHIKLWLRGKKRGCTAHVISAGTVQTAEDAPLPKSLGWLVASLKRASSVGGASFAVLVLKDAAIEETAANDGRETIAAMAPVAG